MGNIVMLLHILNIQNPEVRTDWSYGTNPISSGLSSTARD